MIMMYTPDKAFSAYNNKIVQRRKASSTLSRCFDPASLQCGHWGQLGPHRSDAGKHRFKSG